MIQQFERDGHPGLPRAPAAAAAPPSACHRVVAATGLAAFVLMFGFVYAVRPFAASSDDALLIMVGTAAALFAVDLAWQRVYRRPSTGLDWSLDRPSLARTAVKCLGLLASLGLVGLAYFAFPEYGSAFYAPYFRMLHRLVPVLVALAPFYIHFVDRRQREPRDGYWHTGQLVLLRWRALDRAILGQHALAWIIKGFFLPLMFTYMCRDLERFLALDPGRVLPDLYHVAYDAMYFVDVGLVSMGYLVAFRLTDTHLRSAEPTALGWVAALVCYEPFWSLVGRQYLAYDSGLDWGRWLATTPVLAALWGGAILALTFVYVWATVSFGARFSNLTHRGIITEGPYRWTKHPAYLAKNLSWWLIAIPFVVQGSVLEALRHCLLLLGLNAIYALRAWTEERHLARDPGYLAYMRWIARHGLFAGVASAAGFLPGSRRG